MVQSRNLSDAVHRPVGPKRVLASHHHQPSMYPTQGQPPAYPYHYQAVTFPASHDLSGTQSYPTWTYGYTYASQLQQHQQYQQHYQQQGQAAAAAAAKAQKTASQTAASTRTSTPAPPLTHTASTGTTSTFSSYVPQHTRESYSTGTGSGQRGSRRGSNLRGVFSKECECSLIFIARFSILDRKSVV